MSEWIPVSERLPAPNVSVIICLTDKLYTPAEAKLNIDNKSFLQYRWSSTIPIERVTHWMPLPAPPEGSKEECKEESENG